jgi:hypothetical protein
MEWPESVRNRAINEQKLQKSGISRSTELKSKSNPPKYLNPHRVFQQNRPKAEIATDEIQVGLSSAFLALADNPLCQFCATPTVV